MNRVLQLWASSQIKHHLLLGERSEKPLRELAATGVWMEDGFTGFRVEKTPVTVVPDPSKVLNL